MPETSRNDVSSRGIPRPGAPGEPEADLCGGWSTTVHAEEHLKCPSSGYPTLVFWLPPGHTGPTFPVSVEEESDKAHSRPKGAHSPDRRGRVVSCLTWKYLFPYGCLYRGFHPALSLILMQCQRCSDIVVLSEGTGPLFPIYPLCCQKYRTFVLPEISE